MPMINTATMSAYISWVVGQAAVHVELLTERCRTHNGDQQLSSHQRSPRKGPCLLEARHEGWQRCRYQTTKRNELNPDAPSTRPARKSIGGMWSMPCNNPLATAGAAPRTTTKKIAASVCLNNTIAIGVHATDGIVCKPVTNEPNAARTTLKTRRGQNRPRSPPTPKTRNPTDTALQGVVRRLRQRVDVVHQRLADCEWRRQHILGPPTPPHEHLPAEHDKRNRGNRRPQRRPTPGADHSTASGVRVQVRRARRVHARALRRNLG